MCGEGAGVGAALAGLGGGGVARAGVAGAVGGVRCVHWGLGSTHRRVHAETEPPAVHQLYTQLYTQLYSGTAH